MQKEIVSVVFSFIKPEFVSEAVKVYQKAIENKKKFKGCIDIQLFRKVNHRNEFMIVSKWKTLEEREEYLKSEFHKKVVGILKLYRQNDPIMKNFEQIMEKDNK